MSVCPIPYNVTNTAERSCSDKCSMFIKEDDPCVFRYMTSELQEIYGLLRDNEKKMAVLHQINDYINQVLEVNEALVVKLED